MTETWLSVGESSALSELLPADCSYFNSPRASGEGEAQRLFTNRIVNVSSAFYRRYSPALSLRHSR